MLIKLDTFPLKCKIAKINPLLKKGIKTEAKSYRPISLLPLISKVTEKSIHDQTRDYLQRNGFINQVLEQIIPQMHDCLG